MSADQLDADYLHEHPELDERRLGKATASEFNNIIARNRGGGEASSRRNYKMQLVLERVTGKTPTRFTNKYMDWGHDTEELAVVELMLRYPDLDIHRCTFIEHDFLAAGASPDRLIGDDGVVEVKCFNSANHYDVLKTGELPRDYIAQVQGQLWITGRKYCMAVMFDPDFPAPADAIILRIERDEKYIDNLMVDVANFLDEVDAAERYIKTYKGDQKNVNR